MEKPKCKLIGEDGNVYNLIGIVRKTLRQEELYEQLETFDCELAEMRQQGAGATYDDMILLAMKYVDPA